MKKIRKGLPETANQRLLRLCSAYRDLPKIDTSDPKQVEQRVDEYLRFCVQNNMIPGIAGCSLWIGVHRSTLNDWKNGTPERKEHQKIIQRFYGVVNELYEDLLMNNMISPQAGIFILKVWFGYKDRSDHVLTFDNNPYKDLTGKEVKKKYLENIPAPDTDELDFITHDKKGST